MQVFDRCIIISDANCCDGNYEDDNDDYDGSNNNDDNDGNYDDYDDQDDHNNDRRGCNLADKDDGTYYHHNVASWWTSYTKFHECILFLLPLPNN